MVCLLFICVLYNDAVSSSDNIALEGGMINEWWIEKDFDRLCVVCPTDRIIKYTTNK
jgi:hypothetical protein